MLLIKSNRHGVKEMNPHIILQDELFEITGCKNTSSLVLHLNDKGIKFQRVGVRGKIYTTVEAFNASMGLYSPTAKKPQSRAIEPVITVD